ncbi:outer membrane beta-barrel protein [Mucilaginibacter sp. SP1R1]|uniref:outer membrane beta-barrel protein n=1 Tax=Mucilaginibacter sp. SP1R1 TaxID=2723091 RepID=UPI00162312E0|nr:outer membrane beta-barrel protein [Mucilaginibacter sp. SP1R1]MBB6152042.1 hypothetical protein [Mucilaginibacter sp. SP1R1]
MKRLLLTLMVLLTGLPLFAQKIEVSLQANSGLFHFGGLSATANSSIIQSSVTGSTQNYTNNPYGSRNAVSYGFGAQVQAVSKSNFIVGLQATYDFLASKVNINQYTPYSPAVFDNDPDASYITAPSANMAVKGSTNLQTRFINLNPYIGYRVQLQKVKLDILPGIDIGFNLSGYDKGTVKDADDKVYIINNKINAPSTDIRLRLGLAATYNQFGITASYARGLTNYEGNMLGDVKIEAHSQLIRFGISYRIF